jgi:hypothetical protein
VNRASCHEITKCSVCTVVYIYCETAFCSLRKQFMESSDYDEIPLCKILYFVTGTGLLAE